VPIVPSKNLGNFSIFFRKKIYATDARAPQHARDHCSEHAKQRVVRYDVIFFSEKKSKNFLSFSAARSAHLATVNSTL